jgi:stalled ribosome alternative rescue factor ArfA
MVMKSSTVKMNLGVTRESQKEQGFFDGRFVARVEKSKKAYTRKEKYKNKNWD